MIDILLLVVVGLVAWLVSGEGAYGAGIVFLSGGQGPEEATANLNAMNALGAHPWELSFSYGRALQEPVLKTWAGQPANVPAAQKAYHLRAKLNGAARFGKYSADQEKAA